jgi:hypothetical protein
VTTDEIIDRLYGLPPDEFTHARDDAVRELRKDGLRAEAARVKALRKPTAAAAAVNQLVRRHRRDVERFLSAAESLRKVQVAGKGDLAAATSAERDALAGLVRTGGDRVRQSLQSAAVDEEAATQLLEGRLEHELEPRGFGTLFAGGVIAPPERAAKTAPPTTSKRPDDSAARAKLREAEERLAEASATEREAHRTWKRAEAALDKAEKAVARARDELTALRS